ncbi:MAG: alpha/beta fold hydrolase [Steroidobacteraceae bacterium]|nr:alpha/beta fold hydrolase [Deltaproteobacteria bacterium]
MLRLAAVWQSRWGPSSVCGNMPKSGDCHIKDFHFASGETLPEVRIHYRTFGKPRRDAQGVVRNAVLILHGTGGDGESLMNVAFTGELFGRGQPLDASRFYLIIPDNLGHGRSSKPSDGLRAHFPRYGYRDMIAAQYRLLTEGLQVNHLRLVMGTSMGGMHTWLWGEIHPDFMDALLPLACLPTQISGRNRMWRKMISEAVRSDPEWQNGDYRTQPHCLKIAAQILFLMGSNPLLRYQEGPTQQKADELFAREVAARLANLDANDLLYSAESSHDYDPGPGLEKIRAPLLAINFGDDLINPPELGILEQQIKLVRRGQALVIPMSAETVGHGTHTKAAVWKRHLENFLKSNAGS